MNFSLLLVWLLNDRHNLRRLLLLLYHCHLRVILVITCHIILDRYSNWNLGVFILVFLLVHSFLNDFGLSCLFRPVLLLSLYYFGLIVIDCDTLSNHDLPPLSTVNNFSLRRSHGLIEVRHILHHGLIKVHHFLDHGLPVGGGLDLLRRINHRRLLKDLDWEWNPWSISKFVPGIVPDAHLKRVIDMDNFSSERNWKWLEHLNLFRLDLANYILWISIVKWQSQSYDAFTFLSSWHTDFVCDSLTLVKKIGFLTLSRAPDVSP